MSGWVCVCVCQCERGVLVEKRRANEVMSGHIYPPIHRLILSLSHSHTSLLTGMSAGLPAKGSSSLSKYVSELFQGLVSAHPSLSLFSHSSHTHASFFQSLSLSLCLALPLSPSLSLSLYHSLLPHPCVFSCWAEEMEGNSV